MSGCSAYNVNCNREISWCANPGQSIDQPTNLSYSLTPRSPWKPLTEYEKNGPSQKRKTYE